MISDIISKERYMVLSPTPVGSGYSIPFKYWDRDQIKAIITDDDGVESTVSSSDYSVTAPGDTGTLTFVPLYTFPAGTAILTITRTVEIEQQTDYRNGDVLDAEVLEKSLDMAAAMMQELKEKLDRTVRIPISDPVSVLQMPSYLARRNMLLGFDGSGNIIPILTSDIEQNLSQALAAENSVLSMYNDPGMVAVRTDMADPLTSNIQKVATNKTNIDTVAASIADVNAVGSNITKVVAVANNEIRINAVQANEANINAVHANKANIDIVAGNKTNIDQVANNTSNINAVNANKTNIDTVATDLDLGLSSTIKIVAGNKANIDTVAGNTSNINAVVSNASDITTVATDLNLGGSSTVKMIAANIATIQAVHANKSNIDAVAANETNINAVKTNEGNINTVATDLALGVSSSVRIVATSIANVNTVATNIAKVNAVEAKLTEITTVHTNITAVNTAATNIAAIIAAPGQATAAATAKGQAEAARDKAQKWAEEAEDTPVETGKYSAFHWSEKSYASAQAAMAADAAANKQILYDGTLYQYTLKQATRPGHIAISFEEVI